MSLWIKSCSVTIQIKANEQHFPVVLFIMLHKVVLTFEYVGDFLQCNHSTDNKVVHKVWVRGSPSLSVTNSNIYLKNYRVNVLG